MTEDFTATRMPANERQLAYDVTLGWNCSVTTFLMQYFLWQNHRSSSVDCNFCGLVLTIVVTLTSVISISQNLAYPIDNLLGFSASKIRVFDQPTFWFQTLGIEGGCLHQYLTIQFPPLIWRSVIKDVKNSINNFFRNHCKNWGRVVEQTAMPGSKTSV